jgi:hypothetical protein
MPQSLANTNNFSFTDDHLGPTSGVLLGDLHELESGSISTLWFWDITRSFPLLGENVTAFEDADLIEPDIVDDRVLREPRTISETLFFWEKANRPFTYIVMSTRIAPYVSIDDRFGATPPKSRFFPDFFNIQKFVDYIVRRPHLSALAQRGISKATKDIHIEIHPEVVREAEEKTLTDDLEAGINVAQESYSTLKKIEVNIEHDPEIVERKTIRFTLVVSGEPDTVLEDEALFKKALLRGISPRARELITVTYSWEKQ